MIGIFGFLHLMQVTEQAHYTKADMVQILMFHNIEHQALHHAQVHLTIQCICWEQYHQNLMVIQAQVE